MNLNEQTTQRDLRFPHRAPPPLAPRAANHHVDLNPSSGTFIRAFNPRYTPTTLCLVLHHLRVQLQPALHFAHSRSRVSKRAQTTRTPLIRMGTPQSSETYHRSLLRPRQRGTRTSGERSTLLPATPKTTLRILRGAHTALVPVQLSGSPPDRFYEVEHSDEENAIFESAFHLRPPVPERNFLISPPDAHPWTGNSRPMGCTRR